MPAQRLHFILTIAAPVSRVWDLMLAPESYKDWISGRGRWSASRRCANDHRAEQACPPADRA
ncbi:MAG: hypothetical protein O9318_16215 [Hylemonella sp.]|uniref:hypothetical protein n=1 Tax=Hylemonella sp. TaxID=2066020 RepID=UPI0022C2FD38|nr:hypothetical protein [Hylemonella sp.]MCZ8254012.1 hypothetical protein [Hylemonella sp.]